MLLTIVFIIMKFYAKLFNQKMAYLLDIKTSTLHNQLLCITHTAFLVCDGDDLRVQDNHLVSWYEKRENVTGINILP